MTEFKKNPIDSTLLLTDDYDFDNVRIERLDYGSRFILEDSRCTIIINSEQAEQLKEFLGLERGED